MNFDHFTIRLIIPGDAENYFQLVDRNRKRLEDFFSGTVANTRTIESTQQFLTELKQRIAVRAFYPYGIFDLNTHAIIGYIHVMNLDWNVPKAEIGFFADEAFTGQGIMTKALRAVMHHYYEEQGFNKLFLRTHHTNTAARALAEKCGFEIEGHLRKDYKTTSGELVDMIYYGKLNPGKHHV